MAINQDKIPRSFRSQSAIPNASFVYLGIVRANNDPQRMGRIAVWIPELGPDSEESWFTVSYASPFAGSTPLDDNVEGGKTMDDSQKSYGWWAQSPDIDNQVLVAFINGDTQNGFYFACVYQQNMNHMVPGIGFSKNTTDIEAQKEFGMMGPPVVEYNKKDAEGVDHGILTTDQAIGDEPEGIKRPIFSPLAEGIKTQGLKDDPSRGPSNSSARRQSPAGVFGYLTPRGHQIYVDDGFDDPNNVTSSNNENPSSEKDDLPGKPVDDIRPIIKKLWPQATITSTFRSSNNGLSKANPTSWHTKGYAAADVVPIKGVTFSEYVQKFKDSGYTVIEALEEVGPKKTKHATGDHWHLVLGNSNKPADIKTELPEEAPQIPEAENTGLSTDDNQVNEFIRLRTRSGVQLLLNETSGYIYMISKTGNSWVEISDDAIDVYSAGSINFAADKDINFYAGGNVNVKATSDFNIHSNNTKLYAVKDFQISVDNIIAKSLTDTFFEAGKTFGVRSEANIEFDSEADILMASCGVNSRNAKSILDNAGGPNPSDVKKPDDLSGVPLTRQPTHEPWVRQDLQTGANANGDPTTGIVDSEGNVTDGVLPPINVSESELDWLVTCVMTEAKGESNDGKAGVAQTIVNRMRSGFSENQVNPAWKGSIKGIVLAKNAFSAFQYNFSGGKYGKAVATTWPAIEKRGLSIMAREQKNTALYSKTKAICQQVLSGTYKGGSGVSLVRSRNCLWFYNPRASKPSWARTTIRVTSIGGHNFHARR